MERYDALCGFYYLTIFYGNSVLFHHFCRIGLEHDTTITHFPPGSRVDTLRGLLLLLLLLQHTIATFPLIFIILLNAVPN